MFNKKINKILAVNLALGLSFVSCNFRAVDTKSHGLLYWIKNDAKIWVKSNPVKSIFISLLIPPYLVGGISYVAKKIYESLKENNEIFWSNKEVDSALKKLDKQAFKRRVYKFYKDGKIVEGIEKTYKYVINIYNDDEGIIKTKDDQTFFYESDFCPDLNPDVDYIEICLFENDLFRSHRRYYVKHSNADTKSEMPQVKSENFDDKSEVSQVESEYFENYSEIPQVKSENFDDKSEVSQVESEYFENYSEIPQVESEYFYEISENVVDGKLGRVINSSSNYIEKNLKKERIVFDIDNKITLKNGDEFECVFDYNFKKKKDPVERRPSNFDPMEGSKWLKVQFSDDCMKYYFLIEEDCENFWTKKDYALRNTTNTTYYEVTEFKKAGETFCFKETSRKYIKCINIVRLETKDEKEFIWEDDFDPELHPDIDYILVNDFLSNDFYYFLSEEDEDTLHGKGNW
ncbi:MAG: hypothetical protein RsTaC01_0369 [Candidatus Paraimprobicoccus trichonymphae]|uniref:Lipoprotein n=1 Tax=Candidatus Paraimprobicoccus trichonymphae TaxID=3033793 RepID=A0AA48HZJ4_9FIRM|nr:MAG: hypothetical protein RsTaC01_0369 [Candidatus Paraimprobicoccus trichonymphae]